MMDMETVSGKISFLLENSNLPGPRGNLELLYSFSKTATLDEVNECLSFYSDDLKNSPEEFVMMCGIVGYAKQNQFKLSETLHILRPWASHKSWRIREAVAIAIQEIAETQMEVIITILKTWLEGNALEKRAVITALCEPKLLTNKQIVGKVLGILEQITLELHNVPHKADDVQKSLLKTLGYGWSVGIVRSPEAGKAMFEKMAASDNKHIRWVVKENLKKNRLIRMDKGWVEGFANRL